MGERTARSCIRDLARWGYIEVEEQPGKASSYKVLPPPTHAPGAGVGKLTLAPGAAHPGTSPLRSHAPGADELEPLNKNQELEETFALFWSVYPERYGKKIGKAAALIHWKKLSPDDRAAATLGAKNLAAAVAAELTLPKDPERFLRGRVWEDWQTPAKGGARGSSGVRATPEQITDWRAQGCQHDSSFCNRETALCPPCQRELRRMTAGEGAA